MPLSFSAGAGLPSYSSDTTFHWPSSGVGSFLMTGFFSSFLSSFLSADLSFFSWPWVKAEPRRRVTTRIEAVRIESSTLFSAVAARVAEFGHRSQRQGREPVQRITLQY